MHGMMSKRKSNLNIPYYIYIYIFFQYTVKSLDVEETKYKFPSIITAVTCSQLDLIVKLKLKVESQE